MKLSLFRFISYIGIVPLLLFSAMPCVGESLEALHLKFYNTHTGERLEVTYKKGDHYVPETLEKIDYILRDCRNGKVHSMDPKLLGFLYDLLKELDYQGEVHIISGYRSPETNERLRKRSSGIAKHSLHMQGKALDFRLPGIDTRLLRDKALSMRRGGVGYYKKLDFIHIDTGRVRFW